MKYILPICFLILSLSSPAQQKNTRLPKELQLSAGRCFHGSGDIQGFIFSTGYLKHFKKRLSWSIDLAGTIHDGKSPLFFTGSNGQEIDGSVRYTVAGVQLAAHLAYSFFQRGDHEIQGKAGIVFRYQSSSLPDDYTILYPGATGFPFPVIIFNHTGPQRTFAPGAGVQMQYKFFIRPRVAIGLLAGFQADTAGDNLSQLCLTAGFRL